MAAKRFGSSTPAEKFTMPIHIPLPEPKTNHFAVYRMAMQVIVLGLKIVFQRPLKPIHATVMSQHHLMEMNQQFVICLIPSPQIFSLLNVKLMVTIFGIHFIGMICCV